jgi:hypothetical protein
MHKIADMLKDAEAKDQQEAENFVQQLYSPQRSTPDFTDKKEGWILGTFAELYNRYACPDFGRPELVWARRNMPGTNHADFSVYGADKSYLWDIEVFALFPKPPAKNPKRYQDLWPYPLHPDPSNPAVHDVDIDQLRKSKPYANLERLVEKHLRDKYPPYWLVIYDNEFWVQDRGQLEDPIRQILQKNVGRLPANLKQVWAFSLPSNGKGVLIQAWP